MAPEGITIPILGMDALNDGQTNWMTVEEGVAVATLGWEKGGEVHPISRLTTLRKTIHSANCFAI